MLGRFLRQRFTQILGFHVVEIGAAHRHSVDDIIEEVIPLSDDVYQNTDGNRFELDINGAVAAAYYELAPGVITFTHTEVPAELNGRGIGSKLIKGALDTARAQGLKVVAKCQFVGAYIAKHAEYADLLA